MLEKLIRTTTREWNSLVKATWGDLVGESLADSTNINTDNYLGLDELDEKAFAAECLDSLMEYADGYLRKYGVRLTYSGEIVSKDNPNKEAKPFPEPGTSEWMRLSGVLRSWDPDVNDMLWTAGIVDHIDPLTNPEGSIF